MVSDFIFYDSLFQKNRPTNVAKSLQNRCIPTFAVGLLSTVRQRVEAYKRLTMRKYSRGIAGGQARIFDILSGQTPIVVKIADHMANLLPAVRLIPFCVNGEQGAYCGYGSEFKCESKPACKWLDRLPNKGKARIPGCLKKTDCGYRNMRACKRDVYCKIKRISRRRRVCIAKVTV